MSFSVKILISSRDPHFTNSTNVQQLTIILVAMEIEATAATAGGAGDINDLVFAALPEAVLINVASFLPTIPRGLFGVAMTEQSSAWRNREECRLESTLVLVIADNFVYSRGRRMGSS